jgi:hypothetical protein
MARTGVTTGYAEIDAKLKQLEPNAQKKLSRQALRKGGKLVQRETQQIIEEETDYGEGAYAASISVRAITRTRVKIGVSVLPDRDKYFKEYEKRYGKKPNPATGESEPFYVPAALEFGYMRGDTYVPPLRAQRRGLYDNKEPVLNNFKNDMRELVNEAGQK